MKKLTIVCDLDGVLCTEEKTFSRSLALPIKEEIHNLNKLYSLGHTIIIFTARGWAEYEMTKDWLIRHNVMYHNLICGKPIADILIDDRSFKSLNEYSKTISS